MKQVTFFLLLICILSTGVWAQKPNADSLYIVTHYAKTETMIAMRDGIKLFTTIYAPKDTVQKHPILILERTPYGCNPYGENNFLALWDSYYKLYCQQHYILVVQDVRGRNLSEGQFVDVRPFIPNKKGHETDEASDAYDTIDWLVKNVAGNNGNVGQFGISYPGFYSTMAALSEHPALKAVSPQAPVTDWFMGDDFHHNGALMLMDAFGFFSGFGVPRPLPTTLYNPGYSITEPDKYKYYLKEGTIKNLSKRLGDSIAFWNDMLHHPNYDAWWQARNPRKYMANIKPAVLTVGGLFDAEDCYGSWGLYKAIEKSNPSSHFNKIIMGPWFHGTWEGRSDGSSLGKIKFGQLTSDWYQKNIEFTFFQQLLNHVAPKDSLAEATVFFTGENNWKTFATWPPTEVKEKAIYLQPGKKLSFVHPRPLPASVKPDGAATFTQYISDPANPVPFDGPERIENRTREYMVADQRFLSKRKDVISFQTDVLKKNITLAGPILADLMVSISSTDADFVVKLIDVFPAKISQTTEGPDSLYYGNSQMNGYQMLVRGDIMRGKYRNSFEQPEPFVPNKMTNVEFTLPDIAHTFQKGHRIMVQIQSSWFPLADRNPQTFTDIYKAEKEQFQKAIIKVFHTEGVASKLLLPILE